MGSQHSTPDPAIWQHLKELMAKHHVDVALLNEVSTQVLKSTPGALYEPWGTRGLDRKRRNWTTAIISPHPLTEIRDARATSVDGRRPNVRFGNSRPGSWIAGVAELSGDETLTCIAIYGLMDELSDASVHRALSDLGPLFSDERYKLRLVMGGDLNITTQYPAGRRLEACKAVLSRIEAYGLTDCLAAKWTGIDEVCGCTLGEACRHTRTRLDPNHPDVPLQVDYLFASKDLVVGPYVCRTLPMDEWRAFSDHAPIVATFG
jgi:endonuclease/exonuclease/phosphatase family metal-dependent hydrolase